METKNQRNINQKCTYFKNSNKGSKNRQYSELKMAAYFCPNEEEMDINTAKNLAKIETHMVKNVKANFKEQF